MRINTYKNEKLGSRRSPSFTIILSYGDAGQLKLKNRTNLQLLKTLRYARAHNAPVKLKNDFAVEVDFSRKNNDPEYAQKTILEVANQVNLTEKDLIN